MSFTRVKPAGWSTNEILTSSQMNALDINVSRSLDGLAGGSYTMTGEMSLNSDAPASKGWTWNSRVIFNNTAAFEGAVAFGEDVTFAENVVIGSAVGDTLTVNSTSTFVNPVLFNGNVTLGNAGGDTITVTGTATFAQAATFSAGGTLTGTFGGNPTFSGAVTFGTTSFFTGISTFADGVAFNGNVSLGNAVTDVTQVVGRMVMTTGHIESRIVLMPDATTATIGINDGDIFYWETLTANCTVTLSTTGAFSGARITLVNEDSGQQVTAADYLITTWSIRNLNAQVRSMTFVYHSSKGWICEQYAAQP